MKSLRLNGQLGPEEQAAPEEQQPVLMDKAVLDQATLILKKKGHEVHDVS